MTKQQLGTGVPNWAKENLPKWIEPVRRPQGPAAWCDNPGILGGGGSVLNRWQSNRFIAYRPRPPSSSTSSTRP